MHACDTQVRSSLATRPHGFEDAALRVASVQAGPRSTQRGRGSSVDRGRARVQLSCVHRQARTDGHCWQFHVGQVAPCASSRRSGLGERVTAMPATEGMAYKSVKHDDVACVHIANVRARTCVWREEGGGGAVSPSPLCMRRHPCRPSCIVAKWLLLGLGPLVINACHIKTQRQSSNRPKVQLTFLLTHPTIVFAHVRSNRGHPHALVIGAGGGPMHTI
jgi:hypothetical protein